MIEVDDDIFENFDEENIPVIKNIYKRKKCSAEKYKTNKNSKNVNLLIQNNMNTNNLSNNQKTTDNIYKENNERENLSNQIDYLENEINLESNDLHLKKSKFFFLLKILRKQTTNQWLETFNSSFKAKSIYSK